MKHKLFKCNFIYSILVITVLTCLLNFIYVPLLSDFFIKYFNLFSTSVILLVISIFIGVSNKMDFKLEAGNMIYVSKAALVIMAIELLISLNFQLLDSIHDRVFAYAICLTPCFGFILSRPLLRLYFIESKLERLDKNSQSN
ncbi:MAG: hypothetical protein RL621_1937 [Bacteroidota bacterium]|jgi:hypothetical protein